MEVKKFLGLFLILSFTEGFVGATPSKIELIAGGYGKNNV